MRWLVAFIYPNEIIDIRSTVLSHCDRGVGIEMGWGEGIRKRRVGDEAEERRRT